jgi:hypothetical protein
MDRRAFLSTLAAGGVVGASGCVGGGRVVLERKRSVTVRPGRGWWEQLPAVDGNGALTLTVRADQPFDVYYFPDADDFAQYEAYVSGDEPDAMPSGHQSLSQTAVQQGNEYGVVEPDNGGRRSISPDDDHYLVVDHSNYGQGVPVDEHGEPLQAFVDLEVINKQLPI